MAYATEADIIALHSEDALNRLADLDGDGTRDAAKVARALDDAAALIDGYIAQRVSLPLDPVPAVLKNLSIDIAVYRLATDAGLLAEDMRRRYEDAISFLRDVAKGTAAIPVPRLSDAPATETRAPNVILLDSAPRRFSRDTLKGL